MNAGSAEESKEPDSTGPASNGPASAVRRGGKPEQAPDQVEAEDLDQTGPDDDDPQLLGAPDERSGYPSAPHGSAGQDAGSMD